MAANRPQRRSRIKAFSQRSARSQARILRLGRNAGLSDSETKRAVTRGVLKPYARSKADRITGSFKGDRPDVVARFGGYEDADELFRAARDHWINELVNAGARVNEDAIDRSVQWMRDSDLAFLAYVILRADGDKLRELASIQSQKSGKNRTRAQINKDLRKALDGENFTPEQLQQLGKYSSSGNWTNPFWYHGD